MVKAQRAQVMAELGPTNAAQDPLTTVETARFALDFVNDRLDKRQVTAIIHSHGHIDHFGGVRGVVDEADVRAGRVPTVAPKDFLGISMDARKAEGMAGG